MGLLIQYLGEHFAEQPSLDELAAQIELSPHHTQRLFTKWVGISPKRFVQYLTLDDAKAQLEASSSVLEAAWSAGLSGGGRLHDLFLALEGTTPGEYKSGGRGVLLRWGVHESLLGPLITAVTDRGLSVLCFLDGETPEWHLSERWPRATYLHDPEATRPWVERLGLLVDLSPEQEQFCPLSLHLRGSGFQLKVWEALLSLPEGTTASYTDIAERIGRPQSVRAVANAVGANPVSVLIPCHRVLRSSGFIGGYRWGTARKRSLLAMERARAESVGIV